MIDFQTDLENLRSSSRKLGQAADAAEAAKRKVDRMDIPLDTPMPINPNPFGPPPGQPRNAFGRMLGLPGVAAAYEQHRQKIAEHLERLRQNTETTSKTFSRIADLYEDYEVDSQTQISQLGSKLDDI